MAKRTAVEGETRGNRYAGILAQRGTSLSECVVLGFRFPDDIHAHGFHFDLMNRKVGTLIFDSTSSGDVVVVVREDGGTAGRIREIARESGGEEFRPCLNG